ncbi:MAG: hypothetical protein KME20_01980 [Kaiparowitsia implicata GSE-PSE-MK54-09C]|jgi:hypothetical protein|nr:hypothetical protein [Kaiparowitsia implicata GSE-PSE-MK54-09C]
MIGVSAVGILMTAGVLIGLVAGYAGGWLKALLIHLIDVLFPFTETLNPQWRRSWGSLILLLHPYSNLSSD